MLCILNSFRFCFALSCLVRVILKVRKNNITNAAKDTYIHTLSTLAQKLVLTLLNNEFILKILISSSFGRKIRERFRLKSH